MAEDLKRRDFLKTSAAAVTMAGPGVISARGANDKVNIGWIGVGTRGNAGIEWLKTASGNDVNSPPSATPTTATSRAPRIGCKTVWGNTPAAYKDYRKLLRTSRSTRSSS